MNSPYSKHRLYLSPPHLSGEEIGLVQNVFQSNWIAPLGPMVDAFEKELAEYIQIQCASATSSGTAAIHLALLLLKVSAGDTVICSTFTFCGSVNPIIYVGAEPVFIDSEPNSWNMDPNLLEMELRKMSRSGMLPKAVIVVHLYGQCADMDPILSICNEYEIPLIEDAAEALGAQYKKKFAGSLGALGVFSFNGNKIITTSGGGMLVSNDESLIRKARFLATQARESAPHYEHIEIGYNYRMSNVLAAIGRGQLRALPDRIAQKRKINEHYRRLLGKTPGVKFMPEPEWSFSNRWLTCITIDPNIFGATREDIRLTLEKYNIESRPLWKPMHLQPAYQRYNVVGGNISKNLFDHGLCLPSGAAMNETDIAFVSGVIQNITA